MINRKKNPKSNIMELWKPENSLSLSLSPFLYLYFSFSIILFLLLDSQNFLSIQFQTQEKWILNEMNGSETKTKKKSLKSSTQREIIVGNIFQSDENTAAIFFFGFYSNQNNNQTKQQKKISTNFIAWRFISAVLHIYTVILCSVLFCF